MIYSLSKDIHDHLAWLLTEAGTGGSDVLGEFTIKFPDGYEADIKVCDGDSRWVDSVLFDDLGHEVQVLEPSDSILGEYPFADHAVEVVLAERRSPYIPDRA